MEDNRLIDNLLGKKRESPYLDSPVKFQKVEEVPETKGEEDIDKELSELYQSAVEKEKKEDEQTKEEPKGLKLGIVEEKKLPKIKFD